MSDKPADSAGENIEQARRETESFEGQTGHGVQFEDGKFAGDVQHTPPSGRTGSYEADNRGGYGTGQPDADGEVHADESPAEPE